jgi:REP element-mobilizing transposase RayT
MNEDSPFFDPSKALSIHYKHLPHWRQDGVTYFITSRLADSIPKERMEQWKANRDLWLENHGVQSLAEVSKLPTVTRNEFHQRFTKQWHDWLDAGAGSCRLREKPTRDLLTQELAAESETTTLDAWVVMPNHFHCLLWCQKGPELGRWTKRVKGKSARLMNDSKGQQGTLWQSEPYDHIVRSEDQLNYYRLYCAENPIKAKLKATDYAVGFGTQEWPSAESLRDWLKQGRPPT